MPKLRLSWIVSGFYGGALGITLVLLVILRSLWPGLVLSGGIIGGALGGSIFGTALVYGVLRDEAALASDPTGIKKIALAMAALCYGGAGGLCLGAIAGGVLPVVFSEKGFWGLMVFQISMGF